MTGTVQIGDLVHGGIVFYVDHSGEHGLVAAPFDQGNDICWQDTSDGSAYIPTGLHDEGVGKGADNTKRIIQLLGQKSNSYAAKICDDLNLGGFQDWFLPSLQELILMHDNLHARGIGGFYTGFGGGYGKAKDAYWSSNEMAPLNGIGSQHHVALLLNFSYGTTMAQGSHPKNSRASLRAVRAF